MTFEDGSEATLFFFYRYIYIFSDGEHGHESIANIVGSINSLIDAVITGHCQSVKNEEAYGDSYVD